MCACTKRIGLSGLNWIYSFKNKKGKTFIIYQTKTFSVWMFWDWTKSDWKHKWMLIGFNWASNPMQLHNRIICVVVRIAQTHTLMHSWGLRERRFFYTFCNFLLNVKRANGFQCSFSFPTCTSHRPFRFLQLLPSHIKVCWKG